jgi:GTPase involved in cell partitioning and DNA repair
MPAPIRRPGTSLPSLAPFGMAPSAHPPLRGQATADRPQPAPADAYRILDAELARYSPELYAKPRLVVATKAHEDDDSQARVEELRGVVGGRVLAMSSVLGVGVEEVLRAAREIVRGEGG